MVECLENARDGGSKGMGRAGGLKSGGKGRAVRGTRHGWKYRGRIERVSPGWGEWSEELRGQHERPGLKTGVSWE